MVLNNKLLRFLQSAPRKASVSDLYENFNTLNISGLHNFQLLVLNHKFFYHNEKLPDYCVPKNVLLCHFPYLRQISTNFQNSFTGTYCEQIAIK